MTPADPAAKSPEDRATAGGDSAGDSTAAREGQCPAGQEDPELAVVVAAWSDLPAAVRAGIVAMVRASGAAG